MVPTEKVRAIFTWALLEFRNVVGGCVILIFHFLRNWDQVNAV